MLAPFCQTRDPDVDRDEVSPWGWDPRRDCVCHPDLENKLRVLC